MEYSPNTDKKMIISTSYLSLTSTTPVSLIIITIYKAERKFHFDIDNSIITSSSVPLKSVHKRDLDDENLFSVPRPFFMLLKNLEVFIRNIQDMTEDNQQEQKELNEYELQELKVRTKWIKEFGKYFINIKETDIYTNYDLDTTGHTSLVYKWELKERGDDYSIYQYSGKSWIEKTKLDYFKQVYKVLPHIQCRYFVYFKDGWISYDITNRFKICTSEVLHIFPVNLPSTTLGASYKKTKYVAQLACNKEYYEDKIYVY